MNRKMIRLILLLLGMASLILGASTFLVVDHPIPSYAQVRADYRPSEAWLLDRHGEVIAVKRVDDTVRRLEWIGLNEISPAAKELLLLSEDKRFFDHAGVDWLALLVSSGTNLLNMIDGKRPRGASTLTMQLAGLLDPELSPINSRRTLRQKWNQILAAREIERSWSKQEILEAYFNLAAFRGEIVGINAASFILFGSHPSALNHAQSSVLMALLKGPLARPEQVARRACALLMVAPHENDAVCGALNDLASVALGVNNRQMSQGSIAPHLAQKLLHIPGSHITTTLDASLQRVAMLSLRQHLMELGERHVKDGAVIVLDNKSGDVLAYVGSSGELSESGAVDGVTALRQAGSTLKPFLYGMAIDEKILTAASVMDDSPIQIYTPMGLYIPQDYDHDFKGLVSLRTALASSLNVPAVRTLGLVGVDHFILTLRTYGFDSLTEDGDHYGSSAALGGVDIKLIDLTNAYRSLVNHGIWRPLRFTPANQVTTQTKVLSQGTAFIISNILSDRAARAMTFGLENPLATRVWTAAKTGTSKDMRDNWCVGYSSRYTVGVWVGNFNGDPMHDVSGVSGAAPVWRDVMDYLHKGAGSQSPGMPRGVTTMQVRFSPSIESPRTEYFIAGTETAEIRIALPGKNEQIRPKILYPTNGTLIAMDPDIPVNHQRVEFNSRGAEEVAWQIDGVRVGNGAEIGWMPTGGRHELVLTDVDGNALDSVAFEVRGAASTR